jgi:hypothetical protein
VQHQVVRLAWQGLYEKMRSRPAISLARNLGISGRGLGKICSRFEIPVPPRDYWTKLAAGKKVTRAALPTAESDVPSEILIQPSVREQALQTARPPSVESDPEQTVDCEQTQPTRPLAAKNVQLATEREVL